MSGENKSEIINIFVVIFTNFTVLDAYGPIQVFGTSNNYEKDFNIKFVVKTIGYNLDTDDRKGNILPREGTTIVPDFTIDTFPKDIRPDILLVPGGFGTRILCNPPKPGMYNDFFSIFD